MKNKLMIVVPTLLLVGFLAIKPPAIGDEQGTVIVTPERTVTPSAKPNLRDFDHEGREPEHFNDHFDEEDDDERSGILPSPSQSDGRPVIQLGDDEYEEEYEDEHGRDREHGRHHDRHHESDDEYEEEGE